MTVCVTVLIQIHPFSVSVVLSTDTGTVVFFFSPEMTNLKRKSHFKKKGTGI